MADTPPVGTLNDGTTTTEIRLAKWLPEGDQYQRRYLPVDPEGGISSDEPGLHADTKVRLWVIRSWSGGEGEDLWDRERSTYRQSTGVRLPTLGDGLILSRLRELTQDSTGAADFADGKRFGLGLGKLWACKDGDAYEWDRSNGRWDTADSTGATTNLCTSLVDGSSGLAINDDQFMFSGHGNDSIWKWDPGSAGIEHYAAAAGDPFIYDPVLQAFNGRLYALDGDDLYLIDTTTTDTRTQKGDLSVGSSDLYIATTPWAYNRMSVSDKGPIWIVRQDNGQTFIAEYNVASDSQAIIGNLPVDFAFPYSIFFTQGFVFVGFRYAHEHAENGDAYLYFQRGAQRGTAGPFRSPTGVTASKPVLIAGQIGNDLICYYDGIIWAYNLTDGGISQVAAQVLGGTIEDVITFGQEIFVGPNTGDKIERYLADEYVASGTLDTGRHDWDYPALLKLLSNAGVITDPLPANTSIAMSVSVDGGSVTALTGTHDTDNDRRFQWAASVPGTDLIGYEFELRVTLATTDSTVTPRVRQINAVVNGVAARIEWILQLDVSDASDSEIDDINGFRGQTLTFSDPWQNRDSDSADSIVVTVEEVITPKLRDRDSSDELTAFIRLRSRDLVDVLGSS